MTNIGVLIPARNALSTIEACLVTVNDQTHPNTRAYVVDDASTDGMGEFLSHRPSWYRSLTRLETRIGWPAALDLAATTAINDGCDELFVMNADDLMRLDCLQRCHQALTSWRDPVEFVVPLVQQLGGQNVVQASTQHATREDFAAGTPIVAFCLVTADAWFGVGGYHTDVNLPGLLAGCNEMDFYWRLISGGARYRVLVDQSPLIYYRMHPGQLHRAVVARHQEAVALVHAKHPELNPGGSRK